MHLKFTPQGETTPVEINGSGGDHALMLENDNSKRESEVVTAVEADFAEMQDLGNDLFDRVYSFLREFDSGAAAEQWLMNIRDAVRGEGTAHLFHRDAEGNEVEFQIADAVVDVTLVRILRKSAMFRLHVRGGRVTLIPPEEET